MKTTEELNHKTIEPTVKHRMRWWIPATIAALGYREVARLNALGAKTWNTPAVAGEFLLVRNAQEAVCYKLSKRAANVGN